MRLPFFVKTVYSFRKSIRTGAGTARLEGDVGMRTTSRNAPATACVAVSRKKVVCAARARFPSFALSRGLALMAVCFAALAVSNASLPLG